jgi:hypothetical protein
MAGILSMALAISMPTEGELPQPAHGNHQDNRQNGADDAAG